MKETVVRMDILESSVDYFTNTITINYDGEYDNEVVCQYVCKNHSSLFGECGFLPLVDSKPSVYKGLHNPGVIRVLQWQY